MEQARTVTQRALDRSGVTVDPALAKSSVEEEEESLDGDIVTTCLRDGALCRPMRIRST